MCLCAYCVKPHLFIIVEATQRNASTPFYHCAITLFYSPLICLIIKFISLWPRVSQMSVKKIRVHWISTLVYLCSNFTINCIDDCLRPLIVDKSSVSNWVISKHLRQMRQKAIYPLGTTLTINDCMSRRIMHTFTCAEKKSAIIRNPGDKSRFWGTWRQLCSRLQSPRQGRRVTCRSGPHSGPLLSWSRRCCIFSSRSFVYASSLWITTVEMIICLLNETRRGETSVGPPTSLQFGRRRSLRL